LIVTGCGAADIATAGAKWPASETADDAPISLSYMQINHVKGKSKRFLGKPNPVSSGCPSFRRGSSRGGELTRFSLAPTLKMGALERSEMFRE